MTNIVAALLLALAVAVAPAVALTEARLCFLLFSDVSDLGWTYAFNVARLDMVRRLKSEFPNTTITVNVHAGGIAMAPPQRDAVITRMATQEGCLVIATNSDFVTTAHALRYPAVSFMNVIDGRFRPASVPPNLAPFVYQQYQPFYAMGAAAAYQAKRAVGIIVAWAPPVTAGLAANYFIAGVRSVNATLPAHVVTTGSWYNPKAEVVAATELVALGCDVIARSSDPFDTDKYVAGLDDVDGRPAVFTMGVHIPLQQFVGDTAMASSVPDWTPALLPLLRDVLANGRFTTTTAVRTAFAVLEPWSALTTPAAAAAGDAVVRQWGNASGIRLCDGPYQTLDGTAVATELETAGAAAGKQCAIDVNASTYIRFPFTTFHSTHNFTDGGVACGPGTHFVYDRAPELTLRCVPCPVGSYRPAHQMRAGRTCTACPNGTTSTVGASVCTAIPPPASKSSDTPTIVIGVVLGVVVAAAAVTVAGFFLYMHFKTPASRRSGNAPKDSNEPFAIVFTDIQASTALWAHAPQHMGPAIDLHHAVLRGLVPKHSGYEVKTVGDSFMVAFKCPKNAVSFALAVQTDLLTADWGTDIFDRAYAEQLLDLGASIPSTCQGASLWQGLRVRVGLHYGTGTVKIDEATGGYDYYGTVVNTAARVEAVGHGGQVLATSALVRALGHADRDAVMAVSDLGPQPLRGLADPVHLHQLLPTALRGRVFPDLRLDHETGLLEETTSEGSVSSMGDTTTADGTHRKYTTGSISSRKSSQPSPGRGSVFPQVAQRLGLRCDGAALALCYAAVDAVLSTSAPAVRTATVVDWAKRWRIQRPFPSWVRRAGRALTADGSGGRGSTNAALLLVLGRALGTVEMPGPGPLHGHGRATPPRSSVALNENDATRTPPRGDPGVLPHQTAEP